MKEYELALSQADSVLAIFATFSEERQNLPSTRNMVEECYLHKAQLYYEIHKYGEMRNSLELAVEHNDEFTFRQDADIENWWHHYYMAMGDYERSMECLDSAVRAYTRINATSRP